MANKRYHSSSKMMGEAAYPDMPVGFQTKDYPMAGGELSGMLDDTIVGIDRQLNEDHKQMKKGFKPKKI